MGGGHAGCDAAAAAARTGAKTALVTQRLDTVGELSCNPSIGGIGKGHLVREIDALDGLMGKVADDAGIHYRILNRRKGPAVRGPRAQMDRDLYKDSMQNELRNYPNLHLIEASVEDLLLEEPSVVSKSTSGLESLAPIDDSILNDNNGDRNVASAQRIILPNSQDRKARICGVKVQDKDGSTHELQSRAVVITTGTFLRGVLMLGHDRYSGGRHLRDSEQVEPPSVGLAQTLARFDFPLGRLKTGTPARLNGDTINWDACVIQPTENPATPFSHLLQFNGEQPPNLAANRYVNCYQTATNDKTHELVLKYEHTLPIYDGMDGAGNGPRYCPSIYKKVQRFPDRERHNSFLEPEGLNTNIVYPNGMSGPYPEDIQLKIMRSMKGLEQVEIVRPGYDVEYDFVNPQSLSHTLETKSIGGLYLAGQICGTTGYEEAAAQGIVAGANAGRAAAAASAGMAPPSPFIVGRDEGYIGVLVDDLVTRGTNEPYRMFTSRAEYRISLRADNADMRLTEKGIQYGLVQDEERKAALEAREYLIEDRVSVLKSFQLKTSEWADLGGSENMGGSAKGLASGQRKTAEEVLQMPRVTLKDVEEIMETVLNQASSNDDGAELSSSSSSTLPIIPRATSRQTPLPTFFSQSPPSIRDTVEASVKYQSYAERQHRDMDSWRRAQGLRIPPDVEYSFKTLPIMSAEELEKLNTVRPNTFAEASQISGMTPQSLVYLYHHVTRRRRRRKQRTATAKVGVANTPGGDDEEDSES